MPTRTLAALLMASTVTVASADDLTAYIAGQAAHCWTTPVALRGISFSADFELTFDRNGDVEVATIAAVTPKTATSEALAADLAGAFKRCGPFITEGMRDIAVTVSWPESYAALITD